MLLTLEELQRTLKAPATGDVRTEGRAPPGALSFPELRLGTASLRAVARAAVKTPNVPPRRRRRPRRRLPRTESFYSVSPAHGLTELKGRLGATRRDRNLRQRLRDQPGLADPMIAEPPSIIMSNDRLPAPLAAAAARLDPAKFGNRELLDSFRAGRPMSPPTFRRQVRCALQVGGRADSTRRS